MGETIKMPEQSYIGKWSYGDANPDEIYIAEINEDTIKFYFSLYKITTVYATAKIENNEIKFTEDDVECPIKGRLAFHENRGISVIIDESEFEYIEADTIYDFPFKESSS